MKETALKSNRYQFVARGLVKNAVVVWSGHLTLESTLETSKTRTGGRAHTQKTPRSRHLLSYCVSECARACSTLEQDCN